MDKNSFTYAENDDGSEATYAADGYSLSIVKVLHPLFLASLIADNKLLSSKHCIINSANTIAFLFKNPYRHFDLMVTVGFRSRLKYPTSLVTLKSKTICLWMDSIYIYIYIYIYI